MRLSLVSLSTVLVLGVAACSSPEGLGPKSPSLSAVTGTATDATVRYVAVEGGCWGLATAQGSYEPTSLPAEFRIDGLAVRVVMRGAPLAVSSCMIATLVTLDSISKR